jgi:hypothetical protein
VGRNPLHVESPLGRLLAVEFAWRVALEEMDCSWHFAPEVMVMEGRVLSGFRRELSEPDWIGSAVCGACSGCKETAVVKQWTDK